MEEARELNGHYEAEDLVSVWVGTFPNRQTFDEYLKEFYPEDESEDKPVQCECAFWKDLDIDWNDHDYQAAHFETEPVDAATLLNEMDWSDSYAPAVQRACQARGIQHANAIVVIFEYDYPIEANFTSAYLTYIGSFPYSTGSHPFRR